MRGSGEILLVSTYELGHQPSGITAPKAWLERAGFRPAALDLSVEPFDEERVRAARLIALSVPMHTALRLALGAVARIRPVQPSATLVFHGLYALLHEAMLREAGAGAVLGGECEADLVAIAEALEAGEPLPARTPLRHLAHPVPSRTGLPPLERYAKLADSDGTERVAGYAETTRGCKHLCRHCPIPPVYGGRFFALPAADVVEDVAQQVAAGATHVTFGDPDFLNGPRHALRVASAIHDRFPRLTFDFTAKIEHLVRDAPLLPALRAAGALFVVSAVESLSDDVLAKLDKGHRRQDVATAFAACRAAGLALRPSLVPFTPWSTLEDYLDLLETFAREGWAGTLDPVQLSIRLLVPPRSLLLDDPALRAEELDLAPLGSAPAALRSARAESEEAALTYRWRHPDPRMDRLQAKVAREVEQAAAAGRDAAVTFERVHVLALAAAGRPHAHVVVAADTGRRAPRLTESWFC